MAQKSGTFLSIFNEGRKGFEDIIDGLTVQGEGGEGLIDAELAKELGVDSILLLMNKGLGCACLGLIPNAGMGAGRSTVGNMLCFDLTDKTAGVLNGPVVLDTEQDFLAKVLEQGMGQVTITQRGLKTADGLGRDETDGAAAAGLVPEVQITETILTGADDFLIFITHQKYRTGLIPLRLQGPLLHDVKETQLDEGVDDSAGETPGGERQVNKIERPVQHFFHLQGVGLDGAKSINQVRVLKGREDLRNTGFDAASNLVIKAGKIWVR